MFGGDLLGWILFYVLLMGMTVLAVIEGGAWGLFGKKYQNYLNYGKINEERDLTLLKCLVYADSGKFVAELNYNSRYMAFYSKELYESGDKENSYQHSFYVHNINDPEFGWKSIRYIDDTFDTYEYQNEGTISYENREKLWEFKHQLMDLPLVTKNSTFQDLFKKQEVDLS